MNFKQITLAAAALVFASASYATPLYTGSTTSATALLPNTSQNSNTSGYYIWNDEASMADWHIRWTSDLNDNTTITNWFGQLTFRDSGLESGSAKSVTFENGDKFKVTYDDFFTGKDVVQFISATNNTGGIDGFDFSIEEGYELMVFNLGTSLFSADSTNIDTASSNIYIGADLKNPDVWISNTPNGTLQSFEIAVPEPSILALFGLGLAGLGFTARKKAKA